MGEERTETEVVALKFALLMAQGCHTGLYSEEAPNGSMCEHTAHNTCGRRLAKGDSHICKSSHEISIVCHRHYFHWNARKVAG